MEHFGVLKARLEPLGLASSTHTETIALAAVRMADIESYDESIEEHGHMYETKTVAKDRILKANPAVAMRNEALRHLQSLLAELGLTPTSIGKADASIGRGKKEEDCENKSRWKKYQQ
jgi:P27 family predicted phage terminase small subunit